MKQLLVVSFAVMMMVGVIAGCTPKSQDVNLTGKFEYTPKDYSAIGVITVAEQGKISVLREGAKEILIDFAKLDGKTVKISGFLEYMTEGIGQPLKGPWITKTYTLEEQK